MPSSLDFCGCVTDVEVVEIASNESPDAWRDMEEVKSMADKLVENGPISVCEVQPNHMEV